MIQNLKDLEKLLKLLRRQGVQEFKHGEISLKLGDLPAEPGTIQVQEEIPSDNPYVNFPQGMLSPEQLAFYSAGGRPEDDPENGEIQ